MSYGLTGVARLLGAVGKGNGHIFVNGISVEVVVVDTSPGGVYLQLVILPSCGNVLAVARDKGQQHKQTNAKSPATKGECLMQQGRVCRPVKIAVYITRNRGGSNSLIINAL